MKPRTILYSALLALCATGALAAEPVAEATISFANLGGINDWRADGDRALYVQGRNQKWYHAELMGSCIDLPNAERIGFVAQLAANWVRLARKAVSVDELAVVVSRRSIHRIDADLGWHLWATDLCLTSITTHRRFARIVRLPVFHNSLNDHVLPAAFHASAARLWAKHAVFGELPTLCGTIDERFFAAASAR